MAISLPFPDEGLHQGKEPGFVGSTSVATSISSDSTNEKGTFSRSGSASHYAPIASYEGAHRYDPDFQWEPKEEQRLVRRLDLKVCAFCCLTFFALQLDRGNITQAVSDNMITDLGMNTNDYNTGQTIFTVCFLLAELPSQLISKKLGAERWIPIQMVSWSLVASFQAFMRTKSSFFACRALLGMLEGGFIPDTVLYLSYFYTSKELPIRLSFFWTAYQFTSIISAFMAFGILHMRNINGMPGWAWLFALEGTLTGLIGVSAWFYLPASPCQTANRWRESWFTEREEKIIVNRVLRDDPSKGDMNNRQGLGLGLIWKCLSDYDMWPIFLLGLTWGVPVNPLTQYLTLQLKSVGFTTFETNLLTIPAYVIFIIGLLVITQISERRNERLMLATISQIWPFAMLVALEVLPVHSNRWSRWALTILVVGTPYIHAILVALTSRNAGSVRTRAVAAAVYNIAVQLSNIIGSNIYRNADKPLYRKGNKILLGFVAYNLCVFVGAKLYYITRNIRRAAVWNAMSKEERENYLSTTKDEGNKRLDFRFAH